MTYANPDFNNTWHFIQYANEATNGGLGVMLPIIIFITLFMMMLPYDPRKALGAASFVTFLSSVLLYLLGATHGMMVIFSMLALGFGAFVLYTSER